MKKRGKEIGSREGNEQWIRMEKDDIKKKRLFIFRERGREGEREGEKHRCVVACHMPFSGDLACNPGMCPDWELNP